MNGAAPADPRDRQAGVAALARPTWDINHVIVYGQSLAMGYEGWPALSLTQPYDSLMLGGSVRAGREPVREWLPVGAAEFRPLIATVHDPWSDRPLRPEEVAALPPGDVACGETVLEGAVNLWRGRQLAAGAQPGARRLLASATGVGGRSIEALSRGAEPELFNRFRACVALARDTAAAQNLSYGVVALLFLQGEHNVLGADGCTSDCETYRARLAALHRDMLDEVASITGQAAPPAFFLYQTGGTYANESNSVAQAQLEFALATPGCFMAGPVYPVPDKYGHLDANGYRWMGAQFGKAMHRVLTLGQDFRPLHPLRATLSGRHVGVAFHVPVPPLQWGRPFAGQRRIDPPDCGFAVRDAAGPVPLADVEQVGADGMELTLARDAVGAVLLHYADSSLRGRGALHDSDPQRAPDPYVYDPATGHYADADHPDLNGRPYDLRNWCAAFAILVPAQQPGAQATPAAAPLASPAAPAPTTAAPVAAAVAPVATAVPSPAAPAARTGGAWDTLRETRRDVTGERLPQRQGWFARLAATLLGRSGSANGAAAAAPRTSRAASKPPPSSVPGAD